MEERFLIPLRTWWETWGAQALGRYLQNLLGIVSTRSLLQDFPVGTPWILNKPPGEIRRILWAVALVGGGRSKNTLLNSAAGTLKGGGILHSL